MASGQHDKRTLVTAVALVAALTAFVPGGRLAAQTLCNKPLQPLCSTDVQNFADDTERLRCVGDTERFLEELRNYRDCLKGTLESAEEALKAGEAFGKCLEEGRDDCGLEADSKL